MASCRWQVAGGKLQVAGGKLQVASCKLQVASCKWQVDSSLRIHFHEEILRGISGANLLIRLFAFEL